MELSIVIPTKNRAKLLNNLLQSIDMQPFSKKLYEIIVIDNGSTDQTREVCLKAKKTLTNLRYIYDARPGLHVGRNRGLLASRSSIVAFLDDDALLFPHWIETIVGAFQDSNTMVVCGGVVPFDRGAFEKMKLKKEIKRDFVYYWQASCFWQRGISELDIRSCRISPALIFGGNCAYRKEVLMECKGFHPDGMPNNLLMYRGDGESYVGKYLAQNNKKCMYFAQASIYHVLDSERLSQKSIKRIEYRNGISEIYTLLREEKGKKALQSVMADIKCFLKTHQNFYRIKGKCYLLFYYFLYKQIRDWVHKEDYF